LAGSVLMARQGRNVRLFGVLQRPTRNDIPASFDQTIEMVETFFDETVEVS
jgi:hypothetical protein